MSPSWRIVDGDALERLRELDAGSVQTCVTSPPYFGLRDYGVEPTDWPPVALALPGGVVDVEAMRCALGAETTPAAFVAHLVEIFRGVAGVLRDDGTAWVNLGDSYADRANRRSDGQSFRRDRADVVPGKRNTIDSASGVKAKDLHGIPWLFAFAMRADGWFLRSEIIWHKPNPMPESIRDRPTRAHEQIFLLSKSPSYFYDSFAIRESDHGRAGGPVAFAGRQGGARSTRVDGGTGSTDTWQPGGGRNKRSVWSLATANFPDAHFATFPVALVEPCILAGSSPTACGICGSPWARVVEVEPNPGGISGRAGVAYSKGTPTTTVSNGEKISGRHIYSTARTTGWEPTCEHDDDTGRCVVLDPFSGAATTGLVALRHDRSYVGVELNPEYAAIARARIHDDAPLLNGAAAAG